MTQRDLSEEWAWTQLEGWADGSLTGEGRARVDAAIAVSPRLKAAAERAVAVHRALRAPERELMPRGLRSRLLAIPRQSARRSWALPAFATAVAAVVVAAAIWQRPEPVDPRVAAATRDLEIALHYLQKSARIAEGHVTSTVGTGLRDAFAVTRDALEQSNQDIGGEEI